MTEEVKQKFNEKYPFFGFRLYPDERDKLDSFAKQAGVSRAQVLKLLLNSTTIEQLMEAREAR